MTNEERDALEQLIERGPASHAVMSPSEQKVKTQWPAAYTCSRAGCCLVFITLGPGEDFSGEFDTEAEAWDDAARRLASTEAECIATPGEMLTFETTAGNANVTPPLRAPYAPQQPATQEQVAVTDEAVFVAWWLETWVPHPVTLTMQNIAHSAWLKASSTLRAEQDVLNKRLESMTRERYAVAKRLQKQIADASKLLMAAYNEPAIVTSNAWRSATGAMLSDTPQASDPLQAMLAAERAEKEAFRRTLLSVQRQIEDMSSDESILLAEITAALASRKAEVQP